MNIYSIYKVTNLVNGKIYIGYDSDWPIRISQHRGTYKRTNYAFYYAIRKYGWDNFCWECIYQSKDEHHTKNVMETHFIEYYRSYVGFDDCNGYNMTLGGDGTSGYRYTLEQLEHRKKFYLENFGVDSVSKLPEVVQKRKQTQVELYGFEHYSKTEEHRKKITQSNNERGSRPIVLEAKRLAKETGTKMPKGINFRSDEFLANFINSLS
jgi:predicted GIY-YIG superfamily endonuclease